MPWSVFLLTSLARLPAYLPARKPKSHRLKDSIMSRRHRCSGSTARLFPPSTCSASASPCTIDALPLLLPPGDDGGPSAVVAHGQLGAACQALGVLGHLAEDAEADAADVTCVDDSSMAEAGGAEVD